MKSKLSVCVIDWSDFLYAATLLTNFFDKVYYNPNPTKSAFTEIGAAKLGTGIEGITQIQSIWREEDNIDIFIFCDTDFEEPYAYKLRKDGRLVWGSGVGERFELDRSFFLEEMKSVGLETPKTETIKTFSKEAEYIKDKEDIWVKLNKYRGIAETFPIGSDEDLTKIKMDDVYQKVKPFAEDEDLVFLNQNTIKSKVEYARDRFAVKGNHFSKIPLRSNC